MKLTVKKDSAAQRLGHARFSLAGLVNAVVYPAQNEYADILIKKLQEEFRGEIRYKGGMSRGFGKANLTQSAIGVTQSSKYEEYIRSGTRGPYKGGFPRPVVAWAEAKLGVSTRQAFAIAKSIQKNGTSVPTQQRVVSNGARLSLRLYPREARLGKYSRNYQTRPTTQLGKMYPRDCLQEAQRGKYSQNHPQPTTPQLGKIYPKNSPQEEGNATPSQNLQPTTTQ